MAAPTTRRDIIWGYFAQALNVGAGLILLPLILHYLPREDVGLWFVFVTLGSLAQLLELGFQPTIARNTAYVYAGAQILTKKGLTIPSHDRQFLNLQLLKELVDTARSIYRKVSLVAFIVLLGGGSLYIFSLLNPNQNPWIYLPAWMMFGFGYVATFYYGYFNGLLQGRGDITSANKVVVITRGALIIIGGLFVISGFGISGLGAASLLAAAIGRWASIHYYFSEMRPEAKQVNRMKDVAHYGLFKILWHNSWRLGAVQFGAFMIQRSTILISSSLLGLAVSARYGMTVTIFMAMMNVSIVIANVQLPYMNALQLTGVRSGLKSIFGETLIVAWILFLCGLAFITTIGSYLLQLIGSHTSLIQMPQVLALGIIVLLELNHSIAATYITTKNEIPFIKSAIFSGLFIVFFSLLLAKFWGLWGLIFAQGAVQLAYNNWKWPREAREDLRESWIEILRMGFIRILNRFK